MEDTQTNGKSKLEMSKKRLATAFNNLEGILDKKLNSNQDFIKLNQLKEEEVDQLQKKLQSISDENKKLAQNLQQLDKEYSELQTLNIHALKDLEDSICTIESLLEVEK